MGVDLFFVLAGFLIPRHSGEQRKASNCFSSIEARLILRVFLLDLEILDTASGESRKI
jgi:peptidoglycan/LPS O-acetylase OafA/YrhL